MHHRLILCSQAILNCIRARISFNIFSAWSREIQWDICDQDSEFESTLIVSMIQIFFFLIRVFVLAPFEVESYSRVPETKAELIDLFNKSISVWFHRAICAKCHSVPASDAWISDTTPDSEMRVLATARRVGPFEKWEPFFVGTHADPLFDERLPWEGKFDKMPQNYIMCILDYDYDLLTSAFLVHKPGIKRLAEARREKYELVARKTLRELIMPEIHSIYGTNKSCIL